MKTMSFLLAFIAFFSVSKNLSAQRFEGGIQGGLNFSQVDGDQNGGYNKLGINGGVFVHYILPDEKHALGFDLMYMNKGSRNNRDPQGNTPVLIYNYHYVELPVYYLYNQEKYSLRGGLAWAYVFNSKFDDGGSDKDVPGLRNTDYLFHLGGEYKLSKKLSVFAGYQYSIRSIIDTDKSGVNIAFPQLRRNGVYHNLIQLSLKYYLSK